MNIEFLRTPRVRLPSHAINPLILKRLIKAIEDTPEEYFGKLLKITNSFLFFLGILPLWIKVDKLISILPMLIEHLNVHYIF